MFAHLRAPLAWCGGRSDEPKVRAHRQERCEPVHSRDRRETARGDRDHHDGSMHRYLTTDKGTVVHEQIRVKRDSAGVATLVAANTPGLWTSDQITGMSVWA